MRFSWIVDEVSGGISIAGFMAICAKPSAIATLIAIPEDLMPLAENCCKPRTLLGRRLDRRRPERSIKSQRNRIACTWYACCDRSGKTAHVGIANLNQLGGNTLSHRSREDSIKSPVASERALATLYNPGRARRRDWRESWLKSDQGGQVDSYGASRAIRRDRHSETSRDSRSRCQNWL